MSFLDMFSGFRTWIDMEGRVRSKKGEFSLIKVEDVCRQIWREDL